ncbi:MAG: AAA family ATPase, partial [candidate division NC10 bacterium]|nr:AAA family ATPase [candidate division NC10 bacterium]
YVSLFQHAKARPPKGILLSGPPGTGKTLLAKAVASEAQANFISIKGPALMSKWVGEAERGVREVFKKAKQAAPCIIFFDELDAIAPVRSERGDSGVTARVISQLLTELDGIEELRGVVVLAATNRLDMVDPALLRPGRFDSLIEIPLPDEGARLEILKVHTRGRPLAQDVDLPSLARGTEGVSGAEIEAVCQKATMLVIREYLESHPAGEGSGFPGFALTMEHFQRALRLVGRRP